MEKQPLSGRNRIVKLQVEKKKISSVPNTSSVNQKRHEVGDT